MMLILALLVATAALALAIYTHICLSVFVRGIKRLADDFVSDFTEQK